jgi:hypothetical protein
MSKEKEEGKYFTSLYKTLYEFNANPLGAAGFKGAEIQRKKVAQFQIWNF